MDVSVPWPFSGFLQREATMGKRNDDDNVVTRARPGRQGADWVAVLSVIKSLESCCVWNYWKRFCVHVDLVLFSMRVIVVAGVVCLFIGHFSTSTSPTITEGPNNRRNRSIFPKQVTIGIFPKQVTIDRFTGSPL